MLPQGLKSFMRRSASTVNYMSGYYRTILRGKVAILMYHRVLSDKELAGYYIQPGMYVHKDVFELQMRFLQGHFHIVSFSELLSLWKERNLNKDRRYCVITFDDGWLDTYRYAYPVLHKYNIPATIFLPVSYIGTGKWFWTDRLGYFLKHAQDNVKEDVQALLLKRYPEFAWLFNNGMNSVESIIENCKLLSDEKVDILVNGLMEIMGLKTPEERVFLGWDKIEEMSKNNISFGSHSYTHRILTKLDSDDMQREIRDSQAILKRRQINYVPVFCYPNGNFSRDIADQVRIAGYRAAITTEFGLECNKPQNLYALKRVGVHNDISFTVPMFATHISGILHR